MTWIKDFVTSRNNCVLCDAPLTLGFNSSKYRSCKIVDNKIVIEIKPKSFDSSSIVTNLSICMDTLDFCFDFKDKKYLIIEDIQSLKFMFSKATHPYLTKECRKCFNYKLDSHVFNFSWIKAKLTVVDSSFAFERINLINYDDSVVHVIFNYPSLNRTEIYHGSTKRYENDLVNLNKLIKQLDTILLPAELSLPFIEFTSKEVMKEKLKTLMIFS